MKIFLRLFVAAILIWVLLNEPQRQDISAEAVQEVAVTQENASVPSADEQTATPEQPKPGVQTPDPEAEAKAFIYFKESGNRADAINPSSGACGIGQAWPCSKLPCSLQDYQCQDRYFTSYMQSRYGSWQNAKAFWLSKCSSKQGCWW